MNSVSSPAQANHATQTQPTPKVLDCVPLPVATVDGKKVYCLHGGKCKCPRCEEVRHQQQASADAALEKFLANDHLQLERPIRLAIPKQYTVPASYVSPEFAKELKRMHENTREQIPTYYLPDKYYARNAYKAIGPQSVATQTDIAIAQVGIAGCPCADKAECYDM